MKSVADNRRSPSTDFWCSPRSSSSTRSASAHLTRHGDTRPVRRSATPGHGRSGTGKRERHVDGRQHEARTSTRQDDRPRDDAPGCGHRHRVCVDLDNRCGRAPHDGRRSRQLPSLGSGLWWAVQTVTTVGYGDNVPTNVTGQLLAALVMLLGIGFLTVITAAITSTFVSRSAETPTAADTPRRSSYSR